MFYHSGPISTNLTRAFLHMPVSITFLGKRAVAEMAWIGTQVDVRLHMVFNIWDLVKALLADSALENLI